MARPLIDVPFIFFTAVSASLVFIRVAKQKPRGLPVSRCLMISTDSTMKPYDCIQSQISFSVAACGMFPRNNLDMEGVTLLALMSGNRMLALLIADLCRRDSDFVV